MRYSSRAIVVLASALTCGCALPSFSRLAFIQAYRERQNNPTLAAQPGSSATSIRLGGASAAAAAAGQGAPSATPRGQSRAVSPAASTASGRPHKKRAGDGMSDSGSAIGGPVNTAAQQKKAAQLAGQVQDPAERERAILEKKRIQQQQKRAQAARRKERKKQEQEQARLAGDLQVGTPGSSAAGTPTAWQ